MYPRDFPYWHSIEIRMHVNATIILQTYLAEAFPTEASIIVTSLAGFSHLVRLLSPFMRKAL